MSTATTESSHSSPVVSLENLKENLLFNLPEADVILRSCDSHDFRVLKNYITHSSPVLGEKLFLLHKPQPEPGASANPAESNVEGTTANALGVVQLPVEGAILFSRLTYIFPVPPVLPSTVEKIMALLSVAQMYKMDVVLARIRTHISEQEPPLIREETAFSLYSLAQKHGLRTEALQAARCTLSFSSLTIEDLLKEEKLDIMSGAFLYELWKYHQRVRSNLIFELREFKRSTTLAILGDFSCDFFNNEGLPCWLDNYLSSIGTGRVPAFIDLTDFHMELLEHIEDQSGCATCSGLSQNKIREFWKALTATVHGVMAEVRVARHVVAFLRT